MTKTVDICSVDDLPSSKFGLTSAVVAPHSTPASKLAAALEKIVLYFEFFVKLQGY
jgi:hypothetical protein